MAFFNWQPTAGATIPAPLYTTPKAQPWSMTPAPAKAKAPAFGFQSLNPAMQQTLMSAYQRQPAAGQNAAAQAYGQAGLFGALPHLGFGGPAPALTLASLLPEHQAAINTAFGQRSAADQASTLEAYKTGGFLPTVSGMFGGAPVAWEHLTPEAQQTVTTAYQRLPPERQAQAMAAWQSGGLGAVLPLLKEPGLPGYGDMTPEVQAQLKAAYDALDPERQKKAAEAFASGGLVAALPWLHAAPDTTKRQVEYGDLSAERQAALLKTYEGLSPERQRIAAEAYQGQGLGAAMTALGLPGERAGYEDLNAGAQAQAMDRYNALPDWLQERAASAYATGGLEAAMPFLSADVGAMSAEDLIASRYLTSSRRAKRDIRTMRDMLPRGRR